MRVAVAEVLAIHQERKSIRPTHIQFNRQGVKSCKTYVKPGVQGPLQQPINWMLGEKRIG